MFKSEHLDIFINITNLADIYKIQEQWEKAEKLKLQILISAHPPVNNRQFLTLHKIKID